MEEHTRHENELIKKYEEIGYDHTYRFRKGKLIDTKTDDSFYPKDINIVAEHRYEGMSNPSDMSILYVIESSNGNKGTMLVGYGPSGNLELADFFKSIPQKNISNKANLNTNK